MTSLINLCWSFFKAGVVVAGASSIAAGVYFYVRMDEQIRGHVEALLVERFPQFRVSVRGARLIEGQGIALYDLSLTDPSGGGDDRLLVVDELLLVCSAHVTDLLAGPLDVSRVEVKHPQVTCRRSTGGRWNFERLLPLKPCGATLPQLVVRDGAVSIVDEALPGSQAILLRDVTLAVQPTAQAPAPGAWPSLALSGAFEGPQVKRVEIRGTADAILRTFDLTATVTQLIVDGAAAAWIRPHLPESAKSVSVTGIVDGTASATWRCGARGLTVSQAEFMLREGRIEDFRLPRPVLDLKGRIAIQGEQMLVDNLRGKSGGATVALSLNRAGWSLESPLALTARIENAQLDAQWFRALPPLWQEAWIKYRPAGFVDAELQTTFDGRTWKPTAVLRGRELAFETEKFPYRLTDGRGSICYTAADEAAPARLDLDLTGMGGGQPIHVVGQVLDPRPGAAFVIEIRGNDLEIDAHMIEAMQSTPRAVITSLHPAGRFNIAARFERTTPGAAPQSNLQLALTDVRINYDKFPYPLRGISGLVEAQNDQWTFTNLASGGRRMIHCDGYLRPIPSGTELSLRFTGQQTPLDEDLFDALPPSVQHAWTQLQPRGQFDLTADVLYRTGQGKPNIRALIQPRPESSQLRPQFFPYLLERVSGSIAYEDGRVELSEIRGEHDRTVMSTSGAGYFSPDGPWQMKLTGLQADRLTARAELVSALPPSLRTLVTRLQPTGTFELHDGVLEFRKPDAMLTPVESKWDVQLDCHQADLQCGVELQNIHGTVRLIGQSDGQRSSSMGELDLETVTFKGVQFTKVRGPMWMDEGHCRLGAWAQQGASGGARRLSANVYDGTVAADVQVSFEGAAKYGVRANVVGAELGRLIVERLGTQGSLQGKIDANVEVGGEGNRLETLLGKGDVHIRDASIYELSLLASVLKMLRTGSSDAAAFTESDIQFRLQGRHIYLDKLDFLGDVVSLYGQGYTNFDQQVYLVFSGAVRRNDYRLPMVKAIVGQVNSQIMQVYVDGTLSAPHVTTEAFPGLNQVLKQIRADLKSPLETTAERQAELPASGFMSSLRQ